MTPYGTLAGATEYHAAVGNTAWALVAPDPAGHTDAERTSALLRASRALDGRYSRQFSGYKVTSDQARAWPRRDAYDHCADAELSADQVPLAIVHAAYEMALFELTQPGFFAVAVTPGRLTQNEKVDVISRAFFSPQDMAFIIGEGSPLNAFRPNLSLVEDLIGCYLKKADLWHARVV